MWSEREKWKTISIINFLQFPFSANTKKSQKQKKEEENEMKFIHFKQLIRMKFSFLPSFSSSLYIWLFFCCCCRLSGFGGFCGWAERQSTAPSSNNRKLISIFLLISPQLSTHPTCLCLCWKLKRIHLEIILLHNLLAEEKKLLRSSHTLILCLILI